MTYAPQDPRHRVQRTMSEHRLRRRDPEEPIPLWVGLILILIVTVFCAALAWIAADLDWFQGASP